jgi:hypothetical protein
MPLRFYRRVHVIPGVSINFSRSGPSLSLGMRGAHVTFGHGRVTRTIGIPGTGVFYTHTDGRHTGFHSTGYSWLWFVVIALLIAALVSSR